MSDIENFSESDFEALAYKMIKRMVFEQNRRKKKLSNPVTKPFSLADGLDQLTVRDLQKLKFKFEVRTSQTKKAGLIKDLAEKIPKIFLNYLMMIEEDRYDYIKLALRNDGVIPVEILTIEAIEYLETSGYFFLGNYNNEDVLLMPDEIIQACSNIDELNIKAIIKENTMYKRLAAGIVHYYGIINYFDAEMLIRELTNTQITEEKGYDYLIFNVLAKTKEFAPDYEFEIIDGQMYIRDIRSGDDFVNLLNEHLSRPEIPYCRFTKQQYLEAGERDVYERNKHTQDFLNFMQWSYEVTKKEALELLDVIQTDILVGHHLIKIMNQMTKMLEFDSKEIYMELSTIMNNIYNSSRSWAIKGHIPEQLFKEEKKNLYPLNAPVISTLPSTRKKSTKHDKDSKNNVIDFQSAKNPGRNESCQCGSGKKFKHCCGKK